MASIKPNLDKHAFIWNVIQTDNFNRETVADSYMARYLTHDQATRICLILRENTSAKSFDWYKVVHNDYCLKHGLEDLV